jgi:hypothetical protein
MEQGYCLNLKPLSVIWPDPENSYYVIWPESECLQCNTFADAFNVDQLGVELPRQKFDIVYNYTNQQQLQVE